MFDDSSPNRIHQPLRSIPRILIRAELCGNPQAGPAAAWSARLTVVYDHHVRLLEEKLTELAAPPSPPDSIPCCISIWTMTTAWSLIALRGASATCQRLAGLLAATRVSSTRSWRSPPAATPCSFPRFAYPRGEPLHACGPCGAFYQVRATRFGSRLSDASKGKGHLLKSFLTCATWRVTVRDDTDNSPQGPETAF